MKDRDREDDRERERDRDRDYDRENGTNGDDRKGMQHQHPPLVFLPHPSNL